MRSWPSSAVLRSRTGITAALCVIAAGVFRCGIALADKATTKPSSTAIANQSLGEVSDNPTRDANRKPLCISGIYPHLAAYNGHSECGIGAVVPWAGRLWWITYPPHMRTGSNDKLYSIGDDLLLQVHPESVGGTHASRLIHEPSDQLLIGPYAISKEGQVRALDVKAIPGRYTAWATHLTNPDNKAYLVDMEGPIWEVDVNTLQGERLFVKPAPGWHGKGAYTGQNRLIISNNGESSAAHDLPKNWEFPQAEWPRGGENIGVLAEYDGAEWRIVRRRQFVDITGPRGIKGSFNMTDPVWAMGWDRRSVLLAVCDNEEWTTYRLPKASHAMDPTHGWYTEWPRIREVQTNVALMCMHGMFYHFPLDFRPGQARLIRPLASHLRYVTDFCGWNNQLVVSADDTSILENPLAGQSQSNLWFGSIQDMTGWGIGHAFGGPWLGDTVEAETPSEPYLFAGFQGRVLHLAAGETSEVDVLIEVDIEGTGKWTPFGSITIPKSGYIWHAFEDNEPGEWIRFTTSRKATISAYLHYAQANGRERLTDEPLFAGLADNPTPSESVLIRPAGDNGHLQILAGATPQATETSTTLRYFELDGQLRPTEMHDPSRAAAALENLQHPAPLVGNDDASAWVTTDAGQRLRLPRVPGTVPYGRDIREVQSERSLGHIGNIFYEIPRGELGKHVLEYHKMRPVSAHTKSISDFCTWRGLLVLAGVKPDATADGHIFGGQSGAPAVWCGMVDDLWKLGKPVGEGGPWKDSPIQAGKPSDPYLMTGFDRKSVALSHTCSAPVTFTIEVDYSNRDYWKRFEAISVPPGETVTYTFPAPYQAHWVRFVADLDCEATAWLTYE
ncbi:MAG: hypothetical protein ACK5Q5_06365 [Planctomycetaceae bacterium]